jgi:asparagine synthase (glutamine-hydrolysing)
MGIKPLYYSNRGGRWMFASEIKALLPALGSTDLDRDALVDYLTYRFVPDDKTLFKNVRRLNPGHYMTIDLDSGSSACHSYWHIDYTPNSMSIEENAERVRDLLRDSVRRRLVADVPLGVYLSGGLDSSALVALMAEVSDRPVETYTVTFGDSPLSEAAYARTIAERFGTHHHEIDIEMDAVRVLPDVVRHLDEPIGDAATIPLYLMAEETKKHVTVVLSGEGSDELFAGYDKYKVLYYSRLLPPAPRAFRSGKAGRVNALSDRNQARKYRRFVAVFDEREMDNLLTFPVSKKRMFDLTKYFSTGNPLNNLLNLDTATWLPNDLFVKADKMTMAHAVELRVPFMDHNLVEFAATIPADQKMVWGKDKMVYRRAVQPLLPWTIVRRKKQGFTMPLKKWMAEGLREYAMDVAGSTDMPQLDKGTVERVIDDASRDIFTRRQFWTILFLTAWYREVMNEN